MTRVCLDCAAPIAKGSRGRCRPCANAAARRPMPEGFADDARTMGVKRLRQRHGASNGTVRRWLAECGAERFKAGEETAEMRADRVARIRAARPKAAPRGKASAGRVLAARALHRIGHTPPPSGDAERAADFLRRDRWVVYRANDAGKPGLGKFWICGRTLLTDAELVARAERRGWSRDAWKLLPAAGSHVPGRDLGGGHRAAPASSGATP